MASPYDYMNSVGSALVGAPVAFEAGKREAEDRSYALAQRAREEEIENQKVEQLRRQQAADLAASEAIRQNVGKSIPEVYKSVAGAYASSGDTRALPYMQKSQDIQEEEKQKAAHDAMLGVFLGDKKLANDSFSKFAPGFVFDGQSKDASGETLYNFTQVGPDGRPEQMSMTKQQAALKYGIPLDKLMDFESKAIRDSQKQALEMSKLEYKETPEQRAKREADNALIKAKIKEAEANARKAEKEASDKAKDASSQLSDNAIEMHAEMTMQGQNLPARMSKGMVERENAIAERWVAGGRESIAEARAGFKADADTLKYTQRQVSTLEALEKTANKNLSDIRTALKQLPDTGVKFLNKPLRWWQEQKGDPTLSKVAVYLNGLKSEYVRINSGNPNLAVKADLQREIDHMFDTSLPVSAILQRLEAFQSEGRNRVAAQRDILDSTRQSIRNRGRKSETNSPNTSVTNIQSDTIVRNGKTYQKHSDGKYYLVSR